MTADCFDERSARADLRRQAANISAETASHKGESFRLGKLTEQYSLPLRAA